MTRTPSEASKRKTKTLLMMDMKNLPVLSPQQVPATTKDSDEKKREAEDDVAPCEIQKEGKFCKYERVML